MTRLIRLPEQGEVPLSASEVVVAVRLRLVDRCALAFFQPFNPDDERDTWPAERRYLPAGLWGINQPGLRHAQPFDGLAA